jgi:hypothetical protein
MDAEGDAGKAGRSSCTFLPGRTFQGRHDPLVATATRGSRLAQRLGTEGLGRREGSIAMKRQVIGLAASFAFATALVAAQGMSNATPAARSKTSPKDMTLTGCLIQGSSATAFQLDNAKTNPKSTMEKGKSYKLVAAAEDLSFSQYVNHEVKITGALEAAAAQAKTKDLPTLRAKSLTSVADTCTSAGQ